MPRVNSQDQIVQSGNYSYSPIRVVSIDEVNTAIVRLPVCVYIDKKFLWLAYEFCYLRQLGHICDECTDFKQPLGQVSSQYSIDDRNVKSKYNATWVKKKQTSDLDVMINMGNPIVILQMLAVLLSGTRTTI